MPYTAPSTETLKALETAPNIYLILSPDLYILTASNLYLEATHTKRDSIRGKHIFEAFPDNPDYPDADGVQNINASLQKVLLTKKPHNMHIQRYDVPDINNPGRFIQRYWDPSHMPVFDDNGDINYIIQLANNVTDKVLLAIEAANVGTWNIDIESKIMTASARLKELFGFHSTEDVTLEACFNQITEEHRERIIAAVDSIITNGGYYDVTYTVEGFHDKKVRWLRAVGNLDKDAMTGRAVFTGAIMDISDIKQEEIRKNDFINMVSHELKTPLTSLNALIQVAQLKLKDSDDSFLAGAMDKSNMQVKRMTNMINGFLNMSRFELGKIFIEKQNFDISALIIEVIAEAALSTAAHVVHYGDSPKIIVFADKEKILSVISNLISNAIKYSPKGSQVWVHCTKNSQEIIVSVRDEGMGLKQADLKMIFDRYYRVETSNTKHIAGFGIGLYLSSELVKRHGGRIWAESEIDFGSTFYFSLPL
ncbi:ATP-binding protein [Mucilaginibacter flavidus]|uniref:ATP-binding protein n=1 Tax=Mucilaginibacter flavidus TaxID=2949309 RepID=UPI00209226E3|nr:ATP-binding protein [Mucilaginibacter flavidus]MCO5951099.1 ATP-binding protein [Mucilaginibacter flavidus]